MTNKAVSQSYDMKMTSEWLQLSTQTGHYFWKLWLVLFFVGMALTGLIAHGRPGQKHGVQGDDGGL